jgi:hypothetical protein
MDLQHCKVSVHFVTIRDQVRTACCPAPRAHLDSRSQGWPVGQAGRRDGNGKADGFSPQLLCVDMRGVVERERAAGAAIGGGGDSC